MRISIIAFAIALIVGAAQKSEACTSGTASPCDYYAGGGEVFGGEGGKTCRRTAERRNTQEGISATYTATEPIAKLRVLEAFHGIAATELEVSGGGTTCDFQFEEGKKYLVYAYR